MDAAKKHNDLDAGGAPLAFQPVQHRTKLDILSWGAVATEEF
jgi:hypothetical protein